MANSNAISAPNRSAQTKASDINVRSPAANVVNGEAERIVKPFGACWRTLQPRPPETLRR